MLMGPSMGKTAVHGYHHAVVAVRLQDYLESNERNEPLQSAYKRFPSSETTLTRVHNDILLETDNRHCVMLLLLDLSAAFDKVDHHILLKRLDSRFSICGTALDWFRSYLTNRTQLALIKGKKVRTSRTHMSRASRLCPWTHIAPTLYSTTDKMQFHFFADDTQLYISFSPNSDLELASTNSKIQDCLSDLDRWLSLNKLKLNKDKTELL